MFLRRVCTSFLVVAVLSIIGLFGNNVVLTQDRTDIAYNSRNLVRLHVLADSDHPADQRIKEKVRDAIVAKTARLFLGARSATEAVALARRNQESIAALATQTAKKAGAHYGARVQIGTYDFPAKAYPFGIIPAGRYQAVRVILGRGLGANWWCVLFPPLCFQTKPQPRATGGFHIRLAFLDRLLGRH